MLVYFNENGVLKEQLDSYGNLPRVGSQYFKIFAYFENVDLNNYGAAYIRLQRPDINDSEYPVLFMVQADLAYEDGISDSPSKYFAPNGGPNANQTYPCYLFDFSSIMDAADPENPDDDHIVTLLDTPGQWQATITLISTTTGATNVVGTISFNVGGPDDIEQETEITFDIVTHNMATAIAQKLSSNSMYYMRALDNFEEVANNGMLPKSVFSYPNITVWDKVAKSFYKIETLSNDNSIDSDHYYATYTKIVDFNDKLEVFSGIVVLHSSIASTDLSDYAIGQLFYDGTTKTYYKKTSTSPYYELAEDNSGILGSNRIIPKYFISDGVPFAFARNVTLGEIYSIIGNSSVLIDIDEFEEEYLVRITSSAGIFAISLSNPGEQYYTETLRSSDLFLDLFNNANKIEHVPYKGATKDLDLGSHKLKFNGLYGGIYKETKTIDGQPKVILMLDGNQNVGFYGDDGDAVFNTSKLTGTRFFALPDEDGEIATKEWTNNEIPYHQAFVAVIAGILTNINGWELTNFNYVDTTINGYPVYKIVTASDNENVSKEQAKRYLMAMTGSDYLPEYNFNKPLNTFLILPDGTVLKPQWDNSLGLVLYKMKRFADVDYVNNNIITLPTTSGTLTSEQLSSALNKNARIYISGSNVFYEKFKETDTYIYFRAISIHWTEVSGTVNLINNLCLDIKKSDRTYVVGTTDVSFYNKAKLDADFATKDYVVQSIEAVKRNAFKNVDTTEYPTLDDFLDDYPGEEGYVYLYPINISDLDEGYYQYIWEDIDGDEQHEWQYLGTTKIDLSDITVVFRQETFDDGVITVDFSSNTDIQLISLVNAVSVDFVIPQNISQGWISSCTFELGSTVPSFSLTNNSSYNVVFIVNNVQVSSINNMSSNFLGNSVVEALAECNGFNVRIYMKEARV